MVHAGRCLVYLKSWFSVRKVNFSEPKTFESRILVDPNFFAIYNCHLFYLFFDYFVECVSVSFSRFGLRRVAFTCFAMAARVLPRLPG